MGTSSKSQTTNTYDPQSMGTFHGLQPGLQSTLNSYMTNPFGNPFFQTQQQLGTRQSQNLGGTGTSNLLHNMLTSGLFGGASSPAGLEMLQNQGRANTGLQANLGFLNPVQNALGMQQWATGLASQYRPLQTGGTQTQSTGGLGTWLPQLAGGALGMATGMGGMGGLGSLFGGGQASPGTGWGPMGQQSFGGLPTGSMDMSQAGAFAGGGGAPPPFMGGQGGGANWGG